MQAILRCSRSLVSVIEVNMISRCVGNTSVSIFYSFKRFCPEGRRLRRSKPQLSYRRSSVRYSLKHMYSCPVIGLYLANYRTMGGSHTTCKICGSYGN